MQTFFKIVRASVAGVHQKIKFFPKYAVEMWVTCHKEFVAQASRSTLTRQSARGLPVEGQRSRGRGRGPFARMPAQTNQQSLQV